jgi:hypothetical protein
MDSPIQMRHRISFLGESSFSIQEEDKLIEDAITTPYEKVLKILSSLKDFMKELKHTKSIDIVKDLDWVIKRIQSHTLYTYEFSSENEDLEKYSENPEIKNFLEFLSDFSETKEMRRINRRNKEMSKTVKLKETPIIKNQNNTIMSTLTNKSYRKSVSLFKERKEKEETEFKIEIKIPRAESSELSENNRFVKDEIYSESKSILEEQESNSILNYSNSFLATQNITKEQHDLSQVMLKEFNIHDFELQVGKSRVLPLIGKALFKSFNLTELINSNKLDIFLQNLSNGYLPNVHYHNAIHGADVTQTVAMFLTNSDLEELCLFNNIDVLALITSSLAHDIAHPGTNNTFQINSLSEIAIQHNDSSVLENFHAFTFFKFSRKQEFNIFEDFSTMDYKVFRKRIINLILATDLVNHAKILSVFKNKVLTYLSEKERKSDPHSQPTQFISNSSDSLFDEQQKVLDFIIHSADLSHNTKSFKISYKWTELLMEEFWQQGDIEKSLNLPISFLCDRTTADVPSSQIGFIRGIILPTFEVLVDLCPPLSYLKENIDINLECWSKIMEEKKLSTGSTPRGKKAVTFSQTSNILKPESPNKKKVGIFSKEIGFNSSPIQKSKK